MLYERLLQGENNVRFVGNLVNKPTFYISKNGKKIVRFTLERAIGASKTRVPCVMYGGNAELLHKIAQPGAVIEIAGELGSITGELVIVGGYFAAKDERSKRAYTALINGCTTAP